MDKPISKELAAEFSKTFGAEVTKLYGDNASVENVVYHFVKKGISPTSRVRNYVIINEYFKYMQTNEKPSMYGFAIENEDRYNMSYESIRYVVYSYLKKVENKRHIK